MRELKFRFWDTTDKRFIDDPFISKNGQVGYFTGTTIDWIDDIIVQQSTGIKDKHGKDIYDGDIVVHDSISHGMHYGTYFVRNFEIRFVLHNNNLKYCLTAKNENPIYNIWRSHEVEVLGNMFETPELLK